MSKDYTAAVIRLEEAYWAMKVARKRVADEVKADFQRVIREEIARRQKEIEIDFAKRLKEEADRGLPGGIIRSEVLRTQDWGRWKKWRDLAEIEPDRVALQKAKKEAARANSPYVWADDYATLTVRKNTRGEDIEPVVYDMSTNRRDAAGRWWPDATDQIHEREVARDDRQFLRALHDEIQRQIDEGNVAE